MAGNMARTRWSKFATEVVHPKPKYGRISARAYYEAWNLGQWYLELMLLSRFEARGEYGNRLT